jgi:invasion protein IalB
MTRMFVRGFRSALPVAALLLALPQVAAAQDAPPPPGWISACQGPARSDALDCQMEQRAVMSGTGQLVGSVTVRVPAETRKPVLMIRGPLGLSLAGGVVIDVDGAAAETLPLQTCDAGGCYAGAPVPDALLAAMFKGNILNVAFQNLNKETIKLPMSLAGFSAVYGKIK